MRLTAKVSLLTTATVLGLSVLAGPAIPMSAPTTPVVAPYMEMTGANPDNLSAGIDAGLTQVTAAFVIGDVCKPTWDDGTPVATNHDVAQAIADAQSRGVGVVVSFGGAGGIDLARSCKSLARLKAAYQSVIDELNVTSLDFDVEGVAIDPSEKASIKRRFTAIRALQQANPGLAVSVTIGVGQSGLPENQMSFLRLAKKTDTSLDLVNLMTMDYGSPVNDMGAAAISAAQGSLAQLQTLWPTYSYANLGVTPMIGKNDSPKETTTIADARTVQAFAAANGVGRVAFWSLNRDRQCGSSKARGDCSGVRQQPLDFTRAFLG